MNINLFLILVLCASLNNLIHAIGFSCSDLDHMSAHFSLLDLFFCMCILHVLTL